MPTPKLATLMEAYLASAQVPSEPPVKATPADVPVVPMTRWALEDKKRLRKTYSFEDIKLRNEFVRQVLCLEEELGHHGEIYVVGPNVTVRVWSHDIGSVTDLDKEYAKAADTVYKDVVCPIAAIYLSNTVG